MYFYDFDLIKHPHLLLLIKDAKILWKPFILIISFNPCISIHSECIRTTKLNNNLESIAKASSSTTLLAWHAVNKRFKYISTVFHSQIQCWVVAFDAARDSL